MQVEGITTKGNKIRVGEYSIELPPDYGVEKEEKVKTETGWGVKLHIKNDVSGEKATLLVYWEGNKPSFEISDAYDTYTIYHSGKEGGWKIARVSAKTKEEERQTTIEAEGRKGEYRPSSILVEEIVRQLSLNVPSVEVEIGKGDVPKRH